MCAIVTSAADRCDSAMQLKTLRLRVGMHSFQEEEEGKRQKGQGGKAQALICDNGTVLNRQTFQATVQTQEPFVDSGIRNQGLGIREQKAVPRQTPARLQTPATFSSGDSPFSPAPVRDRRSAGKCCEGNKKI